MRGVTILKRGSMSDFPNFDTFSQTISQKHLSHISSPMSQYVFKKHKDTYLYDLDNNKYTDFCLQSGEIFAEHSPKRLTSFVKNALSYGISHANSYNKFLYKAHRYWSEILSSANITFITGFLNAVIIASKSIQKEKIIIGVSNEYLLKKLDPISHLVTCINISENPQDVDLLLFEAIPHIKNQTNTNINAIKKIEVHSRFLFRNIRINFNPEYEHLIVGSPFAGKDLVVSTGLYETPFISPEDGILFLEGAKYFNILQTQQIKIFTHPMIEYFYGYAICQQSIDTALMMKYGVIIEDNIVFFSPKHNEYDYKRLSKALNQL